MTHYGLIEDYEYNATHKRKRYTIWSGPFASVREGEMYSLPKGDGFMITLEYGDKIRVTCPVERTDETYVEQDKAINDALNAYYAPQTPKERLEYLRSQIDAERVSTAELIELQGLVEYIEPGDVQLLEWAGVPEDSGCDCGEADSGAPGHETKPFVHNGKRILNRR
jgi:hypothetical protein